jgi:DNA-binding transcriptional regulator YhcF (GntR family)
VTIEPGTSLYEQMIYAAKKAVISGQMRPGDSFPSVRALSKALKNSPNTPHKVIIHLVAEGLIERASLKRNSASRSLREGAARTRPILASHDRCDQNRSEIIFARRKTSFCPNILA